MIELGPTSAAPAALASLLPVQEDGGVGSWIKILVFLAVFIGPAILKAIQESAAKKRQARGAAQAPRAEAREELEVQLEEEEALEDEHEEAQVSGREQWERLLRGESSAPPPIPNAPAAAPIPAAMPRRVLTQSRALTEEAPLTEARALTETRRPELAQPEQSLETAASYDSLGARPPRLGAEFADFAPQQGLASDREGRPAEHVGAARGFSGSAEFAGFELTGATASKLQREIGAEAAYESAAKTRSLARNRWSRSQLGRSILVAEMLGPPLALRRLESGPTRPLGWS